MLDDDVMRLIPVYGIVQVFSFNKNRKTFYAKR